jgi:hypothetical protein
MMSKLTRRATLVSAIASVAAAALFGACSDDDTTSLGNTGTLTVRLTDAPSLIDSILRVDIFIDRVDGRRAIASDAEIAANVDNASAGGWVTLATPNAVFNLLGLRNGTTRTLHDASIPTGSYSAFRIVIDPSKSSVMLKNGRVLTRNSSPGILFPSVNRSAIRISPSRPVQILGGRTANLIVDFDVGTSLVQRGTSIERDGLLFRPLITATVVDAGVITATLRLVNLTRTELTLWQGGDPLSDARRLQPETDSPCMIVQALEPITVTALGFDAIAHFAPDLVPGASYLLVVFRDTTGRFRVVTLPTRFVAAAGQSGLRVFNATGLAAGLDVSVGAVGAALGPARFIDVLGDSLSAFVDLPAGLSRIRITRHGSSGTLLDIPPQDLPAGERFTLVLLSVRGLPVPRFFIVPSC